MRHLFITGFVVEQTSLIKYVPSTNSYLVVWGPVVWDPRKWKGLLLGDQTTGPQTTNLPLVDSNEIAKNDGKSVRNLLKVKLPKKPEVNFVTCLLSDWSQQLVRSYGCFLFFSEAYRGVKKNPRPQKRVNIFPNVLRSIFESTTGKMVQYLGLITVGVWRILTSISRLFFRPVVSMCMCITFS